jgi:hypothetical protein
VAGVETLRRGRTRAHSMRLGPPKVGGSRGFLAGCLGILACATYAGQPDSGEAGASLAARALMTRLNLSAAERESLHQGAILGKGLPALETSPKALAAALLMVLPARPANVAEEILHLVSVRVSERADASEKLSPDRNDAFNTVVGFSPEESGEVERAMHVAPGDALNLSDQEIAWFRAAAGELRQEQKHQSNAPEAMAAVYRRVLEGRYRAYLEDGLNGIPPYARGDGAYTHSGRQLRAATESLEFLKAHFPEFYVALRHYPRSAPRGLRHRHLLIKKPLRGRPAFVLSHWLVDVDDDRAVIAERQYYVSHTYDSLQIIILCLPYRDATLLAVLSQTFTGKVDGFLSGLRHRIGRKRVQEAIRPLFESLRETFRKGSAHEKPPARESRDSSDYAARMSASRSTSSVEMWWRPGQPMRGGHRIRY